MTELIITEKPSAASKIAEALADGKPIKESEKGVPYYKITHGKKDIIVSCAVGHLFTVDEKQKNGWAYPVFDIQWTASSERKQSAYTQKYAQVIKKLAKQADEFTVACDYDIEGEVIGLNVIRFLCNQKDAGRMKFSTLTKPDLLKAYDHKSKSLDWGQAYAGETRHFLDWMYGINTSRALTAAIKTSGMFKIMSTGRVQGPALKIIVEREKEIQSFKPAPYWDVLLNAKAKGEKFNANHIKEKFWERAEAELVMQHVKGKKEGAVADSQKKEFLQQPPFPFDLTSLQTEAYRALRLQPKKTLSLAQDLYTGGFISYPRTSSQKLPKELEYGKIMDMLSKQPPYASLISRFQGLKPNEGKKTDPAHPAIYPTGLAPKAVDEKAMKLYDLVVRRFLSCFGDPAVRETQKISIDVNKELFVAKGTHTKEKGWHVFYEPYLSLEEETLPSLDKGDRVEVVKISMHDRETQPPKRYTPASIIKELERKNLGTKATRAQIVDTLFERGYVHGNQIQATELGIRTVATLKKNVPSILDEDLTRHFEMEMEEIRSRAKKEDEVLREAKEVLTVLFKEFKQKEKSIGEELGQANKESRDIQNTIGKCPTCSEGTLMMRRGKFGRFVACDKYPDCKTTFSLPSNALVKNSEKICEHCSHPMIMLIKKAKRPQEICINKDCPSKKADEAQQKEEDKIVSEREGAACSKCKDGKLVLRKSIYGKFLGCSKFPKCRYTEKLGNTTQYRAKKK